MDQLFSRVDPDLDPVRLDRPRNLPFSITKVYPGMKRKNVKRRKICTLDGKNNAELKVELLPNEILMNMFSHLNINDLYKCAQVSKKFRQISHDKSFWKCVNLYNQSVSCEFITQIIKLGTEYLNLQGATLLYDADTDLPRENNLKYLNLTESSVEDKFLVKLLRSSKSLEKLSLSGVNYKHFYEMYEQAELDGGTCDCDHHVNMLEVRTSWYLECLFPNAKMLTTLDLSSSSKISPFVCINFESIKEIILVCQDLREANFEYQVSLEEDLDWFVNNLTPKIEKLNVAEISIQDWQMVQLLKRCKNITELDINGSFIGARDPTQLLAISENLSQSLVKLPLPNNTVISQDFLNSLPKLKYLWRQVVGKRNTQHQDGTWIKSQYPQISYNEGNSQIACCAIENFEPKLGFWELKCTVADIPKSWHEYL